MSTSAMENTPAIQLPEAATALRRALDLCAHLPRDKANIVEASLRAHTRTSSRVKAFHTLYDMPIATKYTEMTPERLSMRIGLILEELQELLYKGCGISMTTYFAVGACEEEQQMAEQAASEGLKEALVASNQFDPVEAADALGDIEYVVHGLALELGIDLDAVGNEIHAANMTKIGADGRPIRRADGKTLKGPYYMPPSISTVLAGAMQIGMDKEEIALLYSSKD